MGLLAANGDAKKAITLSVLRGFAFVYLALLFMSNVMPPDYMWYSSTLSEGISLVIGYFFIRKYL